MSGFDVQPARCTRREPSSMKNRMYNVLSVTVQRERNRRPTAAVDNASEMSAKSCVRAAGRAENDGVAGYCARVKDIAQLEQLAVDFVIAQAGVVSCQPDNQGFQLCNQTWSPTNLRTCEAPFT